MWHFSKFKSRFRSIKFFRLSLIGLGPSEIEEILVRLDHQVKNFKSELFRISWYMRGGVTVNDLLNIYSHDDRQSIYEIINENIETVKNTGLPLL